MHGSGKIALPTHLVDVPPEDTAVVQLPPIALLDGRVDLLRIARALGADGGGARHKRLVLIDTDELASAEDVANLLASPKGWLCPLEHKICQFTCV